MKEDAQEIKIPLIFEGFFVRVLVDDVEKIYGKVCEQERKKKEGLK